MLTMAVERDSMKADEAVFDLLSARLPQARRVATCILRDPHAAEDVVQEAALRAWDSRQSLRDPSSVDAWFNRILVNSCRRYLTNSKKRRELHTLEPVVADSGEIGARREELGRAVARLHADEQLVIGLRYGRDLTVAQISAVTGIREGTVKSRLHAAHSHLRAIIDAERRLEGD